MDAAELFIKQMKQTELADTLTEEIFQICDLRVGSVERFCSPETTEVTTLGSSQNGVMVLNMQYETLDGEIDTMAVVVKKLSAEKYENEVAAYELIKNSGGFIPICKSQYRRTNQMKDTL